MVTVSGQRISKSEFSIVVDSSDSIDHISVGPDWGWGADESAPDSLGPGTNLLPSFLRQDDWG